ncbi:MAG TPA: MFS transporter, partial [Burkholderiales bacterium]|nr:MFS transporter [Burkholderiales bacterium]
FQTIFVMTHLPAYLVDKGMTPAQGMTALAVVGLFNIIGSYGCGVLGGRYSKRLILAWIYAIRAVAIGVFVAAPITPAGTYLFAAVLGLTWLGTVPLTNSLVGQIFGVKFLSTLFSISFLGHQLGAFVGAWAGGAVFDFTGSYQLVWMLAIAMSVAAAALCVPIDERTLVRAPA